MQKRKVLPFRNILQLRAGGVSIVEPSFSADPSCQTHPAVLGSGAVLTKAIVMIEKQHSPP